MTDVFYIVRKHPHGLWSQEDLRDTREDARECMLSLRQANPRDTAAWDVWTEDQWARMVDMKLTLDSFEQHSAPPPSPPVDDVHDAAEFAAALGLLPDDRTMQAVATATGNLREVAAWYGTIPDQVYAAFLASQLLGSVHLLSTYDEAAFVRVARAAWARYHTAASNTRRQHEVKQSEG